MHIAENLHFTILAPNSISFREKTSMLIPPMHIALCKYAYCEEKKVLQTFAPNRSTQKV
jgi:hypothetical protein